MAKFAGWLRRGKKPVDIQLGQYPPPPAWEMLRHLNWVKRKPSPTPGRVKVNVELRPFDILRAHGDTIDTPEFGNDLLLTYSVMGGISGDFDNPVTVRPWPVKVNRKGALHTVASSIDIARAYENSVVTGSPVTATFSPAPSKAVMLANDGAASITAQFAGHYKADGTTPDFNGVDSLTWTAGFVTTVQGEFVGVKVSTASGSAQAYRLWAFS